MTSQSSGQSQRSISDLVYVGFNANVVALDRYTGQAVWTWRSPKGSGFVALLVDGDRLIASAQGYVYCLDPLYGQEVWRNPLEGMGIGTPCLASVHGTSAAGAAIAGAAAEIEMQRQASQAASS